MKQLRMSLAAGLMLGLTALVSAQTLRSYSSYFFFGDSLTDMGNTFFVTGQPPAPYYNGRFSNGPTYAEYLVNGLQRSLTSGTVKTNLNFAFAGATATSTYAGPTTPATLTQELGMFQAKGITPGANDLFVVWAGANDVLNYLGSTATPSGSGANTAASAAVATVTSTVQTLAGSGAKNFIVMTLPDISRTARFTTGSAAPAASLAQGATYTYRDGIKSSMASLAASTGAKITVVDTTALLNTIIANSAKFGFTDTTHEVVGTLQAGGSVANPNTYIFWDGIHPTTAVHALFAAALTEAINPEVVLGGAATQANVLALAGDVVADTLDNRLALVRGSSTRHGADGFVTYNYVNGGLDASGYRRQFDFSGSVVTGGFDAKVTDSVTLGLAASAETINAKVKPGAGSFTLNGQMVSGYAVWRPSTVFVEAFGGIGTANLDKIARVTNLGLATAGKTTSTQRELGVKAGVDLTFGNAHLTPFAGVRYFSGKIGAYSESGVDGLNFAYDSHQLKPFYALVGVDGVWPMHLGDMPLSLSMSVVYESSSGRGDETVTGHLADTVAPSAAITSSVTGGDTLKVGASLLGTFSKRWSWSLGYTADNRNSGKAGSQASFGLQTGF
jgi:outer membrane lipase/esterase